jgi:hypothetical protein
MESDDESGGEQEDQEEEEGDARVDEHDVLELRNVPIVPRRWQIVQIEYNTGFLQKRSDVSTLARWYRRFVCANHMMDDEGTAVVNQCRNSHNFLCFLVGIGESD